MSEFDAQRPGHVCGEGCAPYVEVMYQELEKLDESDHIDALYDILNRTRERAALMLLGLSSQVDNIRLSTRAAALLLNLDQEELEHAMGGAGLYPLTGILDHAIRAQGEEGYVGLAMEALLRQELRTPFTDNIDE